MCPVAGATDKQTADKLNEVVQALVGLNYEAICYGTMSDAAAGGVAHELEHIGEICEMLARYYFLICNYMYLHALNTSA